MTYNIIQKKRREAWIWLLFIVLYSLVLYYIKNTSTDADFVRCSVVSSLIVLLVQVRIIVAMAGSLVTPSIIYLGLYYVFQNGLLLLSLFDTDYNSFYLEYFGLHMKDATMFASISNIIAGFACYCVYAFHKTCIKFDKLDKISDTRIAKRALVGVACTGLVAIPLVILKTTVALRGGYFAVRNYEETIPFVFNFVEYMFMPFVVLSLLYKKGSGKKIVIIFAVLWLLLTSFCGDRTTGLSGLLIIAVISYTQSNKMQDEKNRIFKIGAVLVFLVFSVQLFSVLRGQGSVSDMQGGENVIVHFFGELGFSSVTLFSMMDIVPQNEDFLNGLGYFASFVSGFIPASLDPTGTISNLVEYSDIQQQWMDKYYDFEFGFGFSLNSEAYVNFGWFGFISLFFVNYIVFYFLNYSNRRKNQSKFDVYVTFILLFLWCTLPRRGSYYIWKALMYGVIVIRWYILLVTPKIRKNGAC